MPRGVKALLLPLLCGAAAALCLPKPGLCLLAWFCLAPLFILWEDVTFPPRAFFLGFLAGFGFHGTALYWVYDTCRYAGLHPAVGILAWSALASVLAVNWGLIGWLGWRLTREAPAAARPWLWAVVWTAVTVVTERWTPRLCIDLLAYTQWRYLSLIQIGALAGPHFLGFLIILVNASMRQRKNLLAALALLVLVQGYGKVQLGARREPAETARVEILQPSVDQYQKWDETFAERIEENFKELLTRPREASPSLIVWPETSLPYYVDEGKDIAGVMVWSRTLGAYQVVGAVSRDASATFNSAFLIDPGGAVAGTYHKRQLVPFGEFVPIRFLERFIGILSRMGGLTRGKDDPKLFQTPLGPAAAGICYEAMFPRWARRDAGRGARVLFNLTNDGWYKETWGPHQHFGANVYRAVENRVTVIRAGNTGISAVIDPWGVVTARLDLGMRGRLDARVPTQDPFPRRSFYARHGDWFGLLCLFLAASYALYLLSRLRR